MIASWPTIPCAWWHRLSDLLLAPRTSRPWFQQSAASGRTRYAPLRPSLPPSSLEETKQNDRWNACRTWPVARHTERAQPPSGRPPTHRQTSKGPGPDCTPWNGCPIIISVCTSIHPSDSKCICSCKSFTASVFRNQMCLKTAMYFSDSEPTWAGVKRRSHLLLFGASDLSVVTFSMSWLVGLDQSTWQGRLKRERSSIDP